MVCFILIFQDCKISARVSTNVKLSVLKFFILLKKICEKVNFFKILKGRHSLLGGCMNIIFGQFSDI